MQAHTHDNPNSSTERTTESADNSIPSSSTQRPAAKAVVGEGHSAPAVDTPRSPSVKAPGSSSGGAQTSGGAQILGGADKSKCAQKAPASSSGGAQISSEVKAGTKANANDTQKAIAKPKRIAHLLSLALNHGLY